MNTRIVCAFLAAAAAMQAFDISLVKQYTSATDINTISGYAPISVAGPDFKTGAMVDVSAKSSGNGVPKTASDAKRASNFTTAAVTAAVGKVVPLAAPAENGAPTPATHIAFKQSWNSAQAWATMRGNGMPFITLQAFGNANAEGAATWNAKIVMPQANGLYVRFKLPSLGLKGTLEADGPSTYQGRLRAELLVNGHSVWTSEANRMNQLTLNSSDECTGDTEKPALLMPYGVDIGLTSNQQTSGPARTVTLGLGQFSAGQQVEVTLVVRADSQVNRICCIKPGPDDPMESFCTGMVATVNWSDDANPVTFNAGPVL